MTHSFKASKIVIALAAAGMLTGAVYAAETEHILSRGSDTADGQLLVDNEAIQDNFLEIVNGKYTINTSLDWQEATEFGRPTIQLKGGQLAIGAGNSLNIGKAIISGGSLLIQGSDAASSSAGTFTKYQTTFGGYENFDMTGGEVTLEKARIWIGGPINGKYADMNLSGGTLNLKNGQITGMSGTENGETVGNTLNLSGADVKVLEGSNNVINSLHVNMTAGSLDVAKGAQLLLSTYTKDGTAWETPYDKNVGGIIALNGGTLSNAGTTTIAAKAINVNGGNIVNTGAMKLEPMSGDNGTVEVTIGGDVLSSITNKGTLTATNVTIANKGVLNTVSAGDKLAVSNILIEEGGTLNLLDLNSNYTGSTTNSTSTGTAADSIKDQYLLANNKTITLDGGALNYNGSALQFIKLGSNDAAGTLKINSGDYHFGRIIVGKNGIVENAEEATVVIDDLNLTGIPGAAKDSAKAQFTNYGKLTVVKATTSDGLKDTAANQRVTNEGTIYTTMDQLAANTDNKWTISQFGGAISGADDTGVIVETGYKGQYTLDQLKKIETLGLKNFSFANANLVADEQKGGEVAFAEIAKHSLAYLNTTNAVTATVADDAALINMPQTGDYTIGAIRMVDDNGASTTAKTLSIVGATDNDATLTIGGGDSQELFLGVTDAVKITGAVQLGVAGTSNTISQKVEIGNITTAGVSLYDTETGSVTVANTQTWANGGTIAAGSSLTVSNTGALTVKNGLNNSGSVTVEGSLDADYLSGTGSILLSGGALGVLGNAPKAATKQTAAADPFSGALTITNPIYMSQNGGNVVGLGVTSAAAVAAAADFFDDDAKTMNVYYVGKQIGNKTLTIDSNYGVIVDLVGVAATEGFAAEDGVFQGTITANAGSTGKIVFTNLTKDATVLDEETGVRYVQLSAKGSNFEKTTFELGSQYYADPDVGTDGIVKFEVNQKAVDAQLGGLWMADEFTNYLKDVNIGSNRLIRQLAEEEFDQAAFDEAYKLANNLDEITQDQAYNEALSRAEAQFYGTLTAQANAVANMAAAGGVYNVMLDAVEQQAKVLNRRTTLANSIVRADAGVTPWVDVFGTWNTADRLYGSSGYEADIYGVSFGADWTASCGAILGAAVTVGTGDANSVDAATKIDNDADFYGFSIYGAHRVGNVNGKFDLGYMHSSNDLSANVLAERYSESLDADAFTVGLGAEYLLSAGSFNVVPHAGLRYTNLSVDDLSFGVSNDSMNVFQMPVGVTFSGTFETAGMKVAPMFDLSFVPAFGDKDAVAKFGANEEVTRVVDTTPVQMSLGVNAQLNAWTFGVNYELGVGGDDRLNNAFNLNARYTF